jgi:hypothetical protein
MAHLTLPSEVEPESLAELVADCRALCGCHPAGPAEPLHQGLRPAARPVVAIPDSAAALLDGMPDYGD